MKQALEKTYIGAVEAFEIANDKGMNLPLIGYEIVTVPPKIAIQCGYEMVTRLGHDEKGYWVS